ncbi:hypothetical protein F5B21DRAFT_62615 [Xylaria acuta]|nr:hypothetical protein F5B21DRAFT_62615 [Xylaria acuta]
MPTFKVGVFILAYLPFICFLDASFITLCIRYEPWLRVLRSWMLKCSEGTKQSQLTEMLLIVGCYQISDWVYGRLITIPKAHPRQHECRTQYWTFVDIQRIRYVYVIWGLVLIGVDNDDDNALPRLGVVGWNICQLTLMTDKV